MVQPLLGAASWPRRSGKPLPRAVRRLVRGAGIFVVALAVLLVIAAWAVPPMLDWGRFRDAIASIAGAQLGRTVQIGGDVALRLFPQPVLTASDVTLPERGDGMSARIANLRLEVALFPLLGGRLVVRDLVLGSPVLTLPWPWPRSLMNPARPRLPHPFAAHVENGTLHLGFSAITGINAAIHGGPGTEPAPGLAPDTPPLGGFGAEGFAGFDGQRWRFTTALGAPDADGVSAVDLKMQGQGAARDTGGALQGTLSDGILQGHLHAAGPNLALIMPATPLPWQAEAPFVATGARIVSSALHLSLGGTPATGTIALQLAAPSRLDVRLNAASLDLDSWARLLDGSFAGLDAPSIPMRLDLSADGASLLGGVLGAVSGALVIEAGQARLEQVKALLPGDAKLAFSGRVAKDEQALLAAEGAATLDAPDLHATLAWLRALSPGLVDAIPAAVLHSARLGGTLRLSPGLLTAKGLQGSLDGVKMSGGFDLGFGAKPGFAADISLDHLDVDDWLGGHGWGTGMSLAEAGAHFAALDSALHLRAGSASWSGLEFRDLALDAATGAAGLKIDHASASYDGAALEASFLLAPDGKVVGLHGHATTADAAKLLAKLPPASHWLPGLWDGPASFELSADGPPEALGMQMRASAGDLVMEAETLRDTVSATADTTLTLRHPGAPRLLAALGIPGADHFLETGSLAVLAHLHSTTGQVTVQDFAIDAAALHVGGRGQVDFSAADPRLDFDVRAASLALPDLSVLRAMKWPSGWDTPHLQGRVHLAAQEVAIGGALVAQNLETTISAGAGVVLADPVRIELGGGSFAGQFAMDLAQPLPAAALQGTLTGIAIAPSLSTAPVGFDSGHADISLDLRTVGATDAAWWSHLAGDVAFSVHDAHLAGFDLGRVSTLLSGRAKPPRNALQQALSQGGSAGLSGSGSATFDHGLATLAGTRLSSADGIVSAAGTVDVPAGNLALTLGVIPAVASPPYYSLKVSGPVRDFKLVRGRK